MPRHHDDPYRMLAEMIRRRFSEGGAAAADKLCDIIARELGEVILEIALDRVELILFAEERAARLTVH